ncbi:Rieske 2Fe-2S domain-containing protein [Rhodobacter sp. NTK016B]|uniref:Rieske 2Fe-2S domain-containing protein n=1 Tax=Rhodobacter sp. NTK016B TaxID=2759676 RepID=UPI001A8FDD5F|nr:Rieske 2Fe-2S domain-containing protein [Rhodobacter sp. NTK016B]MBN8293672.1 Rieske 2Fe-2S domain-containing protein [Rhodobacter sp. NTK016B]
MSINGWFPLALSDAITAGSSAGAIVKGLEVVVWRDDAGNAHAWEDRCPHRGMKMSFGFVRGDHIACLYHGWQYGVDGQCQKIPAHPELDVPKSICVNTYGAAEAGGMIWAALGEAGDAPTLPDATAVRSLYIEVPLNTALAALPSAVGAKGFTPEGPVARLDSRWGMLLVGLQEIGETSCALHIAVAGRATPETCAQIAMAAARLRDDVEAGVAA